MGLPTKPPARKIPEREAGEPELTAEVSGLRVGKYQRTLVEAHQELQAGRLHPAASGAPKETRNPQACVQPEVGCVQHTYIHTYIHLLPILSPLVLDEGVVLHRQPWRTRNKQGYKEVAGRDLNMALLSPPFNRTDLPTRHLQAAVFVHSFTHSPGIHSAREMSTERQPQCSHL